MTIWHQSSHNLDAVFQFKIHFTIFWIQQIKLTFATTTITGIPRLFDSVDSPSGSNTLSSSVLEAAGCSGFGWVLRVAPVVLPSIGSVYSWKWRTTTNMIKLCTYSSYPNSVGILFQHIFRKYIFYRSVITFHQFLDTCTLQGVQILLSTMG